MLWGIKQSSLLFNTSILLALLKHLVIFVDYNLSEKYTLDKGFLNFMMPRTLKYK